MTAPGAMTHGARLRHAVAGFYSAKDAAIAMPASWSVHTPPDVEAAAAAPLHPSQARASRSIRMAIHDSAEVRVFEDKIHAGHSTLTLGMLPMAPERQRLIDAWNDPGPIKEAGLLLTWPRPEPLHHVHSSQLVNSHSTLPDAVWSTCPPSP